MAKPAIALRQPMELGYVRPHENVELRCAIQSCEPIQDAKHGLRAAIVPWRHTATIQEYAATRSVIMQLGKQRFETPLRQLCELRLGQCGVRIRGSHTRQVRLGQGWRARRGAQRL